MEGKNTKEKIKLINKIIKYEKEWNPKVYKDLYDNKDYNAIAQIVKQLNDLSNITKRLAFFYYQSHKKIKL